MLLIASAVLACFQAFCRFTAYDRVPHPVIANKNEPQRHVPLRLALPA